MDHSGKLRESSYTYGPLRENWTILLTVNNAYFDFFRNWFWAYRQLDITYSIVIIAEDEFVYRKLREFKSETVTLTRSGHASVHESASFGSAAFSTLVSARPSHILNYLKMGINVLYSDIDMVWMQNPFPYFTGDFDMWMELDNVNKDNYCTGLMAIKSNKNNIRLIEGWEKSLQETLQIDQIAFNKVVKHATIRLSILDSNKFPNGFLYFEKFTEEERNLAVILRNDRLSTLQVFLDSAPVPVCSPQITANFSKP
ncbi:uncharacterized protein LOC123555817 [Mercenaria mercenaria]|uniref:uncharacterized protein LOC123555817 n=1 Tax=Mercenaria mercenaria TaxID=6596 RepID=UPI00234E4F68|nr:uncharacterized protein LOC123555817 [Mercenaria mercenaria]